jgi:predicted ArsR family transcriptional regulator
MNDREQRFREQQRARMERYVALREELGEEGAFEVLMEGYPERQRQLMGPYIEGSTLADGFGKVRDVFAQIGLGAEFLDASTPDEDAAYEVLTVCMCRKACDEIGMAQPSPVLCDLDVAATQRAFPDITLEVRHRVLDGAFACVFRYSRPRSDASC